MDLAEQVQALVALSAEQAMSLGATERSDRQVVMFLRPRQHNFKRRLRGASSRKKMSRLAVNFKPKMAAPRGRLPGALLLILAETRSGGVVLGMASTTAPLPKPPADRTRSWEIQPIQHSITPLGLAMASSPLAPSTEAAKTTASSTSTATQHGLGVRFSSAISRRCDAVSAVSGANFADGWSRAMGGGAVSLSAWFGTIYSRTACFAGLAHFVRSMGRGVEAAQIAPSPSARSLQLVARSGVVSGRKGRYGFCPLLVGLVGFHVGPYVKVDHYHILGQGFLVKASVGIYWWAVLVVNWTGDWVTIRALLSLKVLGWGPPVHAACIVAWQ
uniref:Uncharacterized protein n=1 Tax=Oryza sativa subsp. japonica TaxID=39947 RepID=Q8W5D8_ORYSJ|nr:hypothetical protein [Oryza sativa Japonica Group]AAN04160.1 Hypothetical protein [Oryza sativa Japonica Group]